MGLPILKAFVLCERIRNSTNDTGQMDLRGAGLDRFHGTGSFPHKFTFWAFIEVADEKPAGTLQLAIVRADSGRRHFFREVMVTKPDPLSNLRTRIRLFDCEFPSPGIYFVELWYDGFWVVDHRIRVLGVEGD